MKRGAQTNPKGSTGTPERGSLFSPHTQVVIQPVFTCAGCGGQFTERHFCPTMPWGNTAPGPIFVALPQWTVKA